MEIEKEGEGENQGEGARREEVHVNRLEGENQVMRSKDKSR